MLKILAIAAGVVVVLVVAVLAYAATRAGDFRIERSARIKATPDAIQAHLQDFKRWQAWSPWETIDPALKRTHSGAVSGKGAVYAREGNNQVGKGRRIGKGLKIGESSSNSLIAFEGSSNLILDRLIIEGEVVRDDVDTACGGSGG